MKKLLILNLLFISSLVLGEGIPFKPQTDEYIIGRGNANDTHKITFDHGLGGSNPVMETDATGDGFSFSKKVNVKDDLSLGDGTPSDRSFIIDEGAGASNPRLKWDTTSNKWKQFDGTNERDIGAGGAGVDAINILSESNPNAENGTLNWTFTGTGAFVTTSTSSEIHDGFQSFSTDFDAQSENLKSAEITIKEGLLGQSCQARFFYIGGDDSVDITATVRDGNDNQVGSDSFVLQVTTIWTVADVSFLCPSASEVGGDAQLGNLYLQFEQTGVGDSAIFRHDTVHLGGLIGLVEAVLPDVFSAVTTGTCSSILSRGGGGDIITGAVNSSSGICDVAVSAGSLTVLPECQCTSKTNAGIICELDPGGLSLTNLRFRLRTDAGVAADNDISISCTKQGVDSKQSVTVFKSIPKVADNSNSFSVVTSGDCAAISTTDNGAFTAADNPSLGLCDLTIQAGLLTVLPQCNCSLFSQSGHSCDIDNGGLSLTNLRLRTRDNGGTLVDEDVHVECTKQGVDFKLPTVQPILVKQVETTNKAGITTESCKINNNGTATLDTTSTLCEGFLSSVARPGEGNVTFVIKAGVFSKVPNCTVSMLNNDHCGYFNNTEVTITNGEFVTRLCSANTVVDGDLYLSCQGVR